MRHTMRTYNWYKREERKEYYLDRDLDLCLRLAFLPDLWDFSVDLERLRLDFFFFSLLTSGVGDLLDSESERFLLDLAEPFLLALLSCRECLSLCVSISLSFLFFDLPFSSLKVELPFSFSFSFSLVFGLSFFLSDSFSLSLSFFFLSFSWLRLLSLLLSLSLLEAFCLCLLLRLWLLSLRSLLLFLSLSLSFSLSLSRLRLLLSLARALPRSLDLDLLLRLLRSRESLRSFLCWPVRSALLLLLSLPFTLRRLWELWLRLRRRDLWEDERLRLLFLRGEEDREELREDAVEEEEEEERLLLWLVLERELLLWPLAGESLPPRPDRSFPRPKCLPSLISISLRDLRLSTKGSASLSFMSSFWEFSDSPTSYSPLSLFNLSFPVSSVERKTKTQIKIQKVKTHYSTVTLIVATALMLKSDQQ